MSVLCCRIPDFLVTLAVRRSPALAGRPLALLGGDARVWAASSTAQEEGVAPGMAARQARALCPDLLLRPVETAEAEGAQESFLGEVARWELPLEVQGWGAAYIDLRDVAAAPDAVQPLAADLGRRVRTLLGQPLQPALGWDSSKFTARAAATAAAPGAVRLVERRDEQRFLSPLPITLLPLPWPALQQLHWLGIRSLGQFAELPPAAVWQRFGQAGKVAQRWAQGRDNRPLAPTAHASPEMVLVEMDPPSDQSVRVLEGCLEALRPVLRRLATALAGCRRLRLELAFLDGSKRHEEIVFVEPVASEARVQAALAQRLQSLIWPAELERVEMTLLESGELVAGQLPLFAEEQGGADDAGGTGVVLAQRLTGRYGRCFFLGQVVEAAHPVAERASHLQAL
jgi:nucleotidyltransferase/DNA polymerase involved in DNA repair